MNKWLITSGVMLSLLSANSYAVMGKRYVATPQQSQWEMVVNTPLECQLVHPIPSFGDAVFSSRASKKSIWILNLRCVALWVKHAMSA